jgi:hypothetical protein
MFDFSSKTKTQYNSFKIEPPPPGQPFAMEAHALRARQRVSMRSALAASLIFYLLLFTFYFLFSMGAEMRSS